MVCFFFVQLSTGARERNGRFEKVLHEFVARVCSLPNESMERLVEIFANGRRERAPVFHWLSHWLNTRENANQ